MKEIGEELLILFVVECGGISVTSFFQHLYFPIEGYSAYFWME